MRIEATALGFTSAKFDSTTRYLSRLDVALHAERAVGDNRLVLHTLFSGVQGRDSVPVQHLAFVGGPVSAPGFGFHELAGRLALSQRVEWQTKAPFFPIPLGRYGKAPGSITIAPFANVVRISRAAFIPGRYSPAGDGFYPSAGVGFVPFFEALRFDVAYGLGRRTTGYPRPGGWTFSVDISRDFWGIL